MDTSSNKEKYKSALTKWKCDNNVLWYAREPQKPVFRQGEDAMDYAKRIVKYNRIMKKWETAPKPEDYGLVPLLSEHYEMYISLILKFGAQHVRLFNFRLYSELEEFEDFLFEQGFRYESVEKNNGGIEIQFDTSYDFVFSKESAKFRLAVESDDSVHLTGFYFYNENGYKDECQRLNTIADIHDLLMKDNRVTTKKVKGEKDCRNFIQDYTAIYEAARLEDNSIYITTIERYKKLPKYKWPTIKSEWIGYLLLILAYGLPIGYGLYNLVEGDSDSINTFYNPGNTEEVYICTGPQAKSYHKDKECYGLQSCSSDVDIISVDQAIDDGRKPCRYCCK
ncbi:MAG: hypothetical protein IJR29_01530 [Butyrivibrio sp.]|nr:hypothetical protein [Butyrivibrio sp.]